MLQNRIDFIIESRKKLIALLASYYSFYHLHLKLKEMMNDEI